MKRPSWDRWRSLPHGDDGMWPVPARFLDLLYPEVLRAAARVVIHENGGSMLPQAGRRSVGTGSLLCAPQQIPELRQRALLLPAIDIEPTELGLLELLLDGSLRPLTGYLGAIDARAARQNRRFADGSLCPIPAILHASPAVAAQAGEVGQVALRHPEGMVLAILMVSDVWNCDCTEGGRQRGAGADAAMFHVGGQLQGVELPPRPSFVEPAAIGAPPAGRRVGCQIRRVLHVADLEFLATAIRQLDADLLVQLPMSHDPAQWPDNVRLARCTKLAVQHLPAGRVSVAGVAELPGGEDDLSRLLATSVTLLNHGCTHVLFDPPAGSVAAGNHADAVGQIHSELGVEALAFTPTLGDHEGAGARSLGAWGSAPTDGGGGTSAVVQVQRLLEAGQEVPASLSFPNVVAELRRWSRPRSEQGFTVFFTGLSGAGKSTIATCLLAQLLAVDTRPVTLLDGDIVRRLLSSGLGFSKADRDLNIARISFVAAEITKNRGVALCAPIAPYRPARVRARELVSRYGAFIEVYVSTPLAVCEERDRKGLYARARAGELKGMTGLDDPYEAPQNAEIVIDATHGSPEEAAERILAYLVAEGYVTPQESASAPRHPAG